MNLKEITDSFLDAKRLITDPAADEVVSQIIGLGYERKINEVFNALVTNNSYSPDHFQAFPEDVRSIVTSYFSTTSTLPAWADPDQIAIGQEVFSLYGPEIFMLLNLKSLPMCYTCAKGAKVLYMTGRLSAKGGNTDPLARRLMETAQMVANVLAPGGLDPQGEGIITMQKVRLIHASIRYFLKNQELNKAGWAVEALGEPINQEDLAGTLMSFAPVIISGLRQLNIELTDEQLRGYSHCWKVVGSMMGVGDDLLPDTYEEGWELAIKILKHQAGESMEGQELTLSCIEFMKHLCPGNLFDDVPEYMIWYFFQDVQKAVGKDITSMIGLSDKDCFKDRLILVLTRFITGEIGRLEHHQLVQKLSARFNRILLEGIIHYFNHGKKVHFYIPPSLQKDWKLTDSWENQVTSPGLLGYRLALQVKEDSLKSHSLS